MKRNFISVLWLLLLAMGAQAQTLRNADFQTGDASYWKFSHPGTYNALSPAGYEFSVVPKEGEPGNWVARFASTEQSRWCQIRQKIAFKAKADTEKWRLSALVKTEDQGNVIAGLSLRAFSGAGSSTLFEAEAGDASEWTRLNLDVELTGNFDSLAIFCTVQNAGKVWFDELSLQQLSEQEAAAMQPSPEAKAYLDTALAVIRRDALYRDSVDFQALEHRARLMTANAQTPADCHAALRFVLGGLRDQHSSFLTPRQAKVFDGSDTAGLILPTGRLLGPGLAYLKVPPVSGGNPLVTVRYAEALQHLIKLLDGQPLMGWVVDARGNTGGNCFPMLLGLGPVLGEGVFNGRLVNGRLVDTMSYRQGRLLFNDTVVLATEKPYLLRKPMPRVALLFDGQTASSGELLVLSFRQRPGARSFGQPSYGLSTANQHFALSDGAMMFVSASRMTDRAGNAYGGKIVPDVVVADDAKTKVDEVLVAAEKWLRGR